MLEQIDMHLPILDIKISFPAHWVDVEIYVAMN